MNARGAQTQTDRESISAVSPGNELLRAREAPIGGALPARKPDRDAVIAEPDEITKGQIAVPQIAELFDERLRDAVIARLEELIGRQTGKAESPQRRDEIRGHAVVAQLLKFVEGEIPVPRVAKVVHEIARHPMVPKRHERCVLPTRYPALLSDFM